MSERVAPTIERPLTKIVFELDPDDWHGHPSESVWAEPVHGPDCKAVFRLQNSPFFTRGVSYLDQVRTVMHPDGFLQYSGVFARSGHSTYMLLVPVFCPAFNAIWQRLEALGCSYESGKIELSSGKRVFYSVDVPKEADIHKAYAIFEEGEQKKVWVFQEGHVGHDLKDRTPDDLR